MKLTYILRISTGSQTAQNDDLKVLFLLYKDILTSRFNTNIKKIEKWHFNSLMILARYLCLSKSPLGAMLILVWKVLKALHIAVGMFFLDKSDPTFLLHFSNLYTITFTKIVISVTSHLFLKVCWTSRSIATKVCQTPIRALMSYQSLCKPLSCWKSLGLHT